MVTLFHSKELQQIYRACERVMNQTENQIAYVAPDAYLGKPPKNYKQKRAVGLFLYLVHSYGPACHEVLRAKTTAGGRDIYVIVRPFPFHESFHGSRKFHWTWDLKGKHVVPVYGEEDFPAAFKLWFKFRSPLCLCFRRGRFLAKKEVASLVSCLARYLPIKIDLEEASHTLWERGCYRLVENPRVVNWLMKLPLFIRRLVNKYATKVIPRRPRTHHCLLRQKRMHAQPLAC